MEEQFPVPRNTAASEIANSVISLLWQLRCRWNPNHNKFSSLSDTTVVAIFSNLCLCSSVYQYFLLFHKFKFGKFYDGMSFLTLTNHGDGDYYFHWDTISRRMPTKSEEWFTCPWDEDYTQPGIKMIFQEVSGVKPVGILIFKPKKWPPSSIKMLLQILKRYC